MSPGEIAILGLIIGAFAAFTVTLFWVSQEGDRTPQAHRQSPGQRDKKPRYPVDAGLVIDD